MKFWIMIFSAALFAGGTCLGVALQPRLRPQPQTPKPSSELPSGRYNERLSVTRFASQLNLSEEQDYQLDQILGENQRDLEAYGRSIRASQKLCRERVMGLLSEEQKKKLDELVAAEHQARAERDADRTVRTYSNLLDLTPDQAKGFRDAVIEAKNKKDDYYAQRKSGDHEQSRAFFHKVREEQTRAIEKALPPDKFKRYLELSELEQSNR
jgi:hypothetical protein